MPLDPALAAIFLATVIGITDGDTLTVLRDERPVRVRLAEIDAPEKRQPGYSASRQALADLCFGASAVVRPLTIDRYQRLVAHVACRGLDASGAQVRLGHAWVFDRYATDPGLPALQANARAGRVGLWADDAPVPPWEWRQALRRQPQ